MTVDAGAVFNLFAQTGLGSTPTKALHVMGVVNANNSSVLVNSLTGTGTLAGASGYLEVAPVGTNVFPGVITGEPTLVKSAGGHAAADGRGGASTSPSTPPAPPAIRRRRSAR